MPFSSSPQLKRPVSGGSFIANLLLAAVSVILSLLLFEMLARVFIPDTTGSRQLVYNRMPFETESNSAVRYASNSELREVAIYDGAVEYDVSFRSNNWGLADPVDYPQSTPGETARNIAFAGDSFTAGAGAKPWVPILRDRIAEKDPDVRIYNLGVAGTGPVNFFYLLDHLSKKVAFTDIVLIVISDDFKRARWRPLLSRSELRLCEDGHDDVMCMSKNPIATIAGTENLEPVLQSLRKSSPVRPKSGLSKAAGLIRSKFLSRPRPASASAGSGPNWQSDEQLLTNRKIYNLYALLGIRRMFPLSNIYLLHVPENHERVRGRYSIDIGNEINGMGITYVPLISKPWSAGDFRKKDPHPTPAGYERLSGYVEEFMRQSGMLAAKA